MTSFSERQQSIRKRFDVYYNRPFVDRLAHSSSAEPNNGRSGRAIRLCGDLGAADKSRRVIYDQPRRFDIAAHGAASPEFATFPSRDVTVHRSLNDDRFRPDLSANAGILANRQPAGGINFAFHLAVNH